MVRPLKRHMPEYRAAEDRVAWAVYEAFRLDPGMEPPEVKALDNRILMDERAQVMSPTGDTWNYGGAREPLGVTLEFWSPERAEREFLTLFSKLTGLSVAMTPLSTAHTATAGDGGAIDADDLAQVISEAVGDMNEGEPLTAGQWRYVAQQALNALTPTDAQPKAARPVGEEALREALEFYADPDTYFAIGLFPDRPCGEFMEDFSDEHDPGYPKRARAALASHPTTGQETVATPRDGGGREACEQAARRASESLSWQSRRAAASAPGSAGLGETLAWADQEPDLGARTREPSIRQIVHAYYAPHFDTEKTDDLTERYLAALATPATTAETRGPAEGAR
jgi:hypothetical protein